MKTPTTFRVAGRVRYLRYNRTTVKELERRYGKPFNEIVRHTAHSVREVRFLLWTGLRHDDVNVEQVRQFVDFSNVEAIHRAIAVALTRAVSQQQNRTYKGMNCK